MRTRALAALISLFLTGCGATIYGYPLRQAQPDESRVVGVVLDPLLMALELPPLRTIALSKDCKIGFGVVRTDKVNVWSAPPTDSPCLYFSLFVTEGALTIPSDQLMAMIAHELGHLILQHTPQSDAPGPALSEEQWRVIQAQELAADRFAIALLKRTQALSPVASCEAIARFLRRSVPDWYGPRVPTPMEEAVTERVEAAEAACASADAELPTISGLPPL